MASDSGEILRAWDGSRHGSAKQYSHSTAAPNTGEFSRLRGNSQEWDGSRHGSAKQYSHSSLEL